jgi:DNA repair exonuclease SbcCD ATPase subunit
MERRAAARESEQERLAAFGAMTAEQMLAANPSIRPEAAEAFATFPAGKNAAEQTAQIREILEKKNSDMQSLMSEQMALARALAASRVQVGEIEDYLKQVEKATDTPKKSAAPKSACPSCGKTPPKDAAYSPFCGEKPSR